MRGRAVSFRRGKEICLKHEGKFVYICLSERFLFLHQSLTRPSLFSSQNGVWRAVKTGGNRSAKSGDTFIALITVTEAAMRMVIEARLENNTGGSVPIRLAEFERADRQRTLTEEKRDDHWQCVAQRCVRF